MALVLLFWGGWTSIPAILVTRVHTRDLTHGHQITQSPMVLWGGKKCQHVTWPEMMKVQTQAPHLASPSAMLAALLRGVPDSSDMFQLEFPDFAIQVWNHTVNGCEILQHRKDGWNPINHGINDLSAGAGFRNHPQYGFSFQHETLNLWIMQQVFFDRSQAKTACVSSNSTEREEL